MPSDILFKEIHDKAWGKSWPTTTCTIHRRDIFPDETDGDEDTGIDDDDDSFDRIPSKATFTCLLNVDLLRDAFEISGTEFSVIVIRKEYKFLRELLEESDRPFIVTGHPGTGKTMFLLYLLLYRLQLALPTAVQFSPDKYIVFRADGVLVCQTSGLIEHRWMLPLGCWCLTDGNDEATHPCRAFGRRDLRSFLITSPRPDRYKKWRTQVFAKTVIAALPRAVEVAAIAKMHGWKPCEAVSIMQRWGPCTRTVLAILGDPDEENSQRRYAVDVAINIYNDPARFLLRDIGQLPSGKGSTLLFIQPIRCKDNPDYTDSRFIIPTMSLSEIFDDQCQGLSAQSRIRLYEVFGTDLMTRGSAGWLHEKNMHLQMMTMGSKRYEIFNGSVKSHMDSVALVLIGTASALRAAARNRLSSFYWLPSFVDYPGIDAVLVNGNDIYALQAAIADTHEGPRDGIKKVWLTIGADEARRFNWHFVVITDNEPLADKYAMDLGTQLHDVVLGRKPHVRVSAWVCVIKSDVSGRVRCW